MALAVGGGQAGPWSNRTGCRLSGRSQLGRTHSVVFQIFFFLSFVFRNDHIQVRRSVFWFESFLNFNLLFLKILA